MKTNGVGQEGLREIDMPAYDRIPAPVRKVIADAPIALACYGIKQKMRGYTDQWEIDAYAMDLKETVRNIMTGGHDSGTRVNWAKCKGSHPQASKEYPWPEYQLIPRRIGTAKQARYNTRLTRIENRIKRCT